MKIKVYNIHTKERRIFATQKDAAEFVGVPASTMIYRMLNKIDTDGWMFEKMPLTDAEVKKLEKQLARKRELNKVGFVQDSIRDSDREKYKIFHYDKNHANACITPCPYFLSPKPRIGSAKCQDCSYFHGIDRKNQEIACSRNTDSVNRRKSYYRI